MKFIPAISLVLCILAGAAKAQFYSSDANSDTIKTISVVLDDNATDACWTNLREAREYAEEKLRIKDYKVVPERGDYDFVIKVNAFRNSIRVCVYTYAIQIYQPTFHGGIFGFHEIGRHSGVGYNSDNANTDVINLIQGLLDKM